MQNKTGVFVLSPILRNIIGQEKNLIDLRSVVDDGKILLVNLSKGAIGEDIASLLGSFLVTKIQLEVMSRQDTESDKRRPFFLYIDEFQNYATESFAAIFSEARKYGLALTVANQYLSQLETPTREAMFGNVSTLVSFQLGVDDAEIVSRQQGNPIRATTIRAASRRCFARPIGEVEKQIGQMAMAKKKV